MEQLRETLKLTGATITEIVLEPSEKGPKAVLVASAALTPDLARILECQEMFFDGRLAPREFEGHVGLGHLLKNTAVGLRCPSLEDGDEGLEDGDEGLEDGDEGLEAVIALVPDLVHKFRIAHKSDISLELSCRIHLSGAAYLTLLLDFFTAINKKAFDLLLEPRQGELFTEPEAAGHSGNSLNME